MLVRRYHLERPGCGAAALTRSIGVGRAQWALRRRQSGEIQRLVGQLFFQEAAVRVGCRVDRLVSGRVHLPPRLNQRALVVRPDGDFGEDKD